MNSFLHISILTTLLFMAGCKSSNKTIDAVDAGEPVKIGTPAIGSSRPVSMIPKVKIYRTNGDYDNLVPITLDATRTNVISFPDPKDITESSEPVKLDDGFLLDRRGVGMNTAFTHYTYKEYMSLPHAPSASELLAAVIPDARVTEVLEMPFTIESGDIVKRCNEYIRGMEKGTHKATGGQMTITPDF